MRNRGLISVAVALLCACSCRPDTGPDTIAGTVPDTAPGAVSDSVPPGVPVSATVKALRFGYVRSGRWNYVVVVPSKKVFCHVMWVLVGPLKVWTNIFRPCAFGHKGGQEVALAELRRMGDRKSLPAPEEIRISVDLAREIVDLAGRQDDQHVNRFDVAERWFRSGLLPKLWYLDLGDFGESDGR